jgi:hypothetical protein
MSSLSSDLSEILQLKREHLTDDKIIQLGIEERKFEMLEQ